MFEYLKGDIVEITPAYAVIEAQGIGYMVNISLQTYSAIQDKTVAKLFLYESIREDAFVLYGFATSAERKMFLLLISVSGVGAGTARVILSSLSTAELCDAIRTENVNVIKSVKGIGLKTAQRIVAQTCLWFLPLLLIRTLLPKRLPHFPCWDLWRLNRKR